MLPDELEALARGDIKRLGGGRSRPRLRDPRPVALIPGLANRDARTVCTARIEALLALIAGEPGPALDRALAEAAIGAVWRGRSLTGLGAFAEEILGLEEAVARAAAERGAASLELPLAPASDELVAVWLRAEAALLDAGIPGRAFVRGPEPRLVLELDSEHGPKALEAISRRVSILARDHEAPRGREPSSGGREGGREGRREGGREGGRQGRREPPRR